MFYDSLVLFTAYFGFSYTQILSGGNAGVDNWVVKGEAIKRREVNGLDNPYPS